MAEQQTNELPQDVTNAAAGISDEVKGLAQSATAGDLTQPKPPKDEPITFDMQSHTPNADGSYTKRPPEQVTIPAKDGRSFLEMLKGLVGRGGPASEATQSAGDSTQSQLDNKVAVTVTPVQEPGSTGQPGQ